MGDVDVGSSVSDWRSFVAGGEDVMSRDFRLWDGGDCGAIGSSRELLVFC